jgi:ferritin-like metal-binding protein YciE
MNTNHNGHRKASSSSKSSSKSSDKGTDLKDLFETELKDIFWVEKTLVKAIPKMSKKASNEDLVNALDDHLAATQEQVTRLEEVFDSVGIKAQAKECKAMKGIIDEGEELMEEMEEGPVLDAAIISAAQKVEHYEISSYGTLCAFAKTLGHDDAADLLSQTLEEEKEADETLSAIAEALINAEAMQGSSEYNEDEEEEEEGGVATATRKKSSGR